MSENEKEFVSRTDDRGNIHISEKALASIVAAAAKEVDGVSTLGGGRLVSTRGQSAEKKMANSVEIQVNDDKISISLVILVQYGYVIPDVGHAVQEAVADAVGKATGMTVNMVNVHVAGVSFQHRSK